MLVTNSSTCRFSETTSLTSVCGGVVPRSGVTRRTCTPVCQWGGADINNNRLMPLSYGPVSNGGRTISRHRLVPLHVMSCTLLWDGAISRGHMGFLFLHYHNLYYVKYDLILFMPLSPSLSLGFSGYALRSYTAPTTVVSYRMRGERAHTMRGVKTAGDDGFAPTVRARPKTGTRCTRIHGASLIFLLSLWNPVVTYAQ